jgi:hypothetical protein
MAVFISSKPICPIMDSGTFKKLKIFVEGYARVGMTPHVGFIPLYERDRADGLGH